MSLISLETKFHEGCYVSLGNLDKAKHLFDAVPSLLDKRKIGGKDLPTEVLIRKKRRYRSASLDVSWRISPVAFYKSKTKRNGADESAYVNFMKISPSEGKEFIPVPFHSYYLYVFDLIAELAICEFNTQDSDDCP